MKKANTVNRRDDNWWNNPRAVLGRDMDAARPSILQGWCERGGPMSIPALIEKFEERGLSCKGNLNISLDWYGLPQVIWWPGVNWQFKSQFDRLNDCDFQRKSTTVMGLAFDGDHSYRDIYGDYSKPDLPLLRAVRKKFANRTEVRLSGHPGQDYWWPVWLLLRDECEPREPLTIEWESISGAKEQNHYD